MYLEFLFLVSDYFKVLRTKEARFEWGIPLVIAIVSFIVMYNFGMPNGISIFVNNVVKLLAVLIGFSITITVLLTNGNEDNFKLIKQTKTKIKINNNFLSLYQVLIINYSYCVFIEIVVIIGMLFIPLFYSYAPQLEVITIFLISGLILVVLHVLLLNIRNTSNFYFVIIRKGQKKIGSDDN